MPARGLRGALLTVALATALRAGDIETLHVTNFNFDFKPGWTLQIHTRARTFENVTAYNQLRAGPILLWQAAPRLTAIAGYYAINQNRRSTHASYGIHRYWGGGQYRLVARERWSVDGRGIVERHSSGAFKDYWRTRLRAYWTGTSKLGVPYASIEALAQQGIWYGRYTAGLQWKLSRSVIFGAGYEYRDAPVGQGSHIIATFLQWNAYRHTPPHID